MTPKDHHAAIAAARAALEAAQDAVEAAQKAPLADYPIKVGHHVPAQTSMSGTPCKMEVHDILIGLGKAHLTVTLYGRKVNKDGTVSGISCFAFDSIYFEETHHE